MIKGELYCVEFYVNLADSSEYAVNNIGIYLANTSIANIWNYDPLPYIPQIENDSSFPLTSFNTWYKISGTIISNGGEDTLIIGNFHANSTSDTTLVRALPSGQRSNKYSFYYLDNVSVVHLNADAGRDTAICKGNSTIIGRASDPYITSYTWWPSQGLSDTTIAQPTASPTQTTTYYLTATMAGGCSKTDTVTVTVVGVDAGPDTVICQGDTVQIGQLFNQANVTYSWLPLADLSNPTGNQTLAYPPVSTYYLLTANSNGCTMQDSVTITVNPLVNTIIPDMADHSICMGQTVTIGSTAIQGYTYSWNPSLGLNVSNSSSTNATPGVTTTYTLTVTNDLPCSNVLTEEVTVEVKDCTEPVDSLPAEHIFPNILTPNNDGINDEWGLRDFPEGTVLTIYNRWGMLVIRIEQPLSFEGRSVNGKLLPDGSYYYILTFPDGYKHKAFIHISGK